MKHALWVLVLAAGLMPSTRVSASAGTGAELTQSNLAPQAGWPSPVDDTEAHSLTLLEILEYESGNDGALLWDLVSWYGGDLHRLWVKTEGAYDLSTPTTGDADFQLLYGRLATSFFDAQIGARYERASGGNRRAERVSAAFGLQGISLYLFELEAAVFLADAGHLSGRVTASKDFLFTQKAIAQLRAETNAAVRRSDEFETGAGVNDVELGLRFRYEFRRELAPYVGINWKSTFGETADFRRRAGDEAAGLNMVAGLRAWY